MLLRSTLLLLLALSACKTTDPLYCDEDTPCTDPDRPFCDLTGAFPDSDGHGRTCIADPRCEPGDFIECDGETLVTCGPDGLSETTEECDVGCNESYAVCNECEPNTSTCAASVEHPCGEDGTPQPEADCDLGCNEAAEACADISPSNGLGEYLDESSAGPDLVLSSDSTIDTDAGTVFVDGESVDVPSTLVPAPTDGVDVRVFRVNSLHVTGEVVVLGGPAIAFVANEDIVIEGVIRVDANGNTGGPGEGPDGHGIHPIIIDLNGQRPGGGGGGFGKMGGQGGDDGQEGAAGGPIVGSVELVPLRGGGRGAQTANDGPGGGGGGAVQLVSRTIISVADGGVIDAGGAAGGNSEAGGAGGGILLEAPTVVVSDPESALVANGGGGGCAGNVTVQPEDGRRDDQRAAGCASSNSGQGGGGGAGNLSAQRGTDNYGGGGGAVGRIRINNLAGEFSGVGGAIVSPSASVGTISLR